MNKKGFHFFFRSLLAFMLATKLTTVPASAEDGYNYDIGIKLSKDKRLEIGGRIYMQALGGNIEVNGPTDTTTVYQSSFGEGTLNGTATEFELVFRAIITKYVEAGARIKSRFFSNDWTTFWELDDSNANQHIKLRGAYLQFVPPAWGQKIFKRVRIGATDWGDFSIFTVGKIRYIDRDNASGLLLYSEWGKVSAVFGRLALPKVWGGPGFTTEGRGFGKPWSTQDYAYATAWHFKVDPKFNFSVYANYLRDMERQEDSDDESDFETRYENAVGHLDMHFLPTPFINIRLQGAYSGQNYDALRDWNGRENTDITNAIPKDAEDYAAIGTFTFSNLFSEPLAIKAEYFNIGEEFTSLLAARREQDALIMEGFENDDLGWEAGGWSTGGEVQTPTINVDNGETQFTDSLARTIIGWHGGTALVEYASGLLETSGEYSYITYNTNMQDRNLAFYAVNSGLGKPDNAYNANQERETQIAVIRAKLKFNVYKGMELGARIKYIRDIDQRILRDPDDDYNYERLIGELSYGLYVADELKLTVGGTYYDSDIRDGLEDLGYHKIRYFHEGEFQWKDIKIGWILERFDGKWNNFREAIKYEAGLDEFRARAYIDFAF